MIAHSFIRPMPTVSQLAPGLDLDLARQSDCTRTGWLRSLGRGRRQRGAQATQRQQQPGVSEVAQVTVDAPSVALGTEQPFAAPAVIASCDMPEPEPEPEPPVDPAGDDCAEQAAAAVVDGTELEVEPVTPRAGWCILEEPATPDRVGRVRSGSTDDHDHKPDALVQSSVPRSSTVEVDGREHTVYTINLCYPPAEPGTCGTTSQRRWSVERRYSEFAELHDSLAESLASQSDIVLPTVPPSRWIGLMDPTFVAERREGLDGWLGTMLSTSELALQPQLHAFLETPDTILVQLGLRDPPAPTPFPREQSPAVRGDELIQHQQHYLSTAVASAISPPSLTPEPALQARA